MGAFFFMDFPAWMYHAEYGARLFPDAESLEAAGSGWVDHPDKAKATEQTEKPKRAYKRRG